MPKVTLERALRVPAVPARTALSTILHAIAAEESNWADFALYIELGSIGLPDVGYVAIPVIIENLHETLEPRYEIAFTMHARRGADAFPVFTGAIGADASGPSSAQLWMSGEYVTPAHSLGTFFDKTFAHGMAEKTLDNMLGEFVDAVEASVEKRERDRARYRLLSAGG